MTVTFKLNGKPRQSTWLPDMPLLWVLARRSRSQGTKFGCGVSQCGACTVHVRGVATRSCQRRVSDVQGLRSPRSRGLSLRDATGQRAWEELDVPQCGYVQAGQIMSASALLPRTLSHRRGDRHGNGPQHLPLRDLSAQPPSVPSRGRHAGGRQLLAATSTEPLG